MPKLNLTMAMGLYDRTFALFDRQIEVEGCELNPVHLLPEEAFHRAFRHAEFDITEMSLCSHIVTLGRGVDRYMGIPAFTSRAFRHSGIYIRTDRGITTAEDLKGKTIGIPEYQQTANVWIRGILQDEHGVSAADVKWRTGGVEEPGRDERTALDLSTSIDLRPIPPGCTLSDMLAKGELDAMMTARCPSAFFNRRPNVDRLYPDYVPVEEAYYARSKIFPIMHVVGIRKSLVEQHPWLPVSIFKAFVKAKEIATESLGLIGHLAVTLPWPVAQLEQARRLMGHDFWSYGVDPNRHVLETILRYSHEQGLTPRRLPLGALFAHSTIDMTKV
jgi:4,5-dihydroxyphthalate decarboxylase